MVGVSMAMQSGMNTPSQPVSSASAASSAQRVGSLEGRMKPNFMSFRYSRGKTKSSTRRREDTKTRRKPTRSVGRLIQCERLSQSHASQGWPRMMTSISYSYDKEADILYVSFSPGETPTAAIELN